MGRDMGKHMLFIQYNYIIIHTRYDVLARHIYIYIIFVIFGLICADNVLALCRVAGLTYSKLMTTYLSNECVPQTSINLSTSVLDFNHIITYVLPDICYHFLCTLSGFLNWFCLCVSGLNKSTCNLETCIPLSTRLDIVRGFLWCYPNVLSKWILARWNGVGIFLDNYGI